MEDCCSFVYTKVCLNSILNLSFNEKRDSPCIQNRSLPVYIHSAIQHSKDKQ